jgi:hypothetical protein
MKVVGAGIRINLENTIEPRICTDDKRVTSILLISSQHHATQRFIGVFLCKSVAE